MRSVGAMAGRDASHLLEGLTTTEVGHPGLTGSSDELNVNAALQLSPATAFDTGRRSRTPGAGGVGSGSGGIPLMKSYAVRSEGSLGKTNSG